ncbi:Alpha-mannosidase [Vanrija pseudolonga]|uniref:Alpha-mannosidase n=1 Tax=Vanrija pseudolonga TaxID=143232 RepID=A0AAF0Y505_9TREE|nr:Alpha-mannosidase [Vanrija pseudolonga]
MSPANGMPNGHSANGGQFTAKTYPVKSTDARYKFLLKQTERRLREGFIGGYYEDYNLSALLTAHRLDDEAHVKLEYWAAPNGSKASFDEAKNQVYKPVKKGIRLGPNWSNHWFKVEVNIPPEYANYERVQLEFDFAGEGLVYGEDGFAYQGLTGGDYNERRVDFIIPDNHRAAGVGRYYIEASCNGVFGINDDMFGPKNNHFVEQTWELITADLVVPNMDAWRLKWDYEFLVQLWQQLPDESSLSQVARYTANEMINHFRRGDLASCAASRKVAEKVLGDNWERDVDAECQQTVTDGTLWAIGHCHIDTGWLWPYSVTQQKSARSWSTQLDLMDRYPEYVFSATQPQQFQWLQDLYPELFARIVEKSHEGKFEPLGATWVEMDTNLPSGEALARQFLYGQRYFKREFGAYSSTFVLPDTFGYSSQLPQISRLSHAPNFFTQKISWNDTNPFPHTTFNWVGLDGTQVLAHMTPVGTYTAQCKVEDFRKAVTEHRNLEVSKHTLLLFGNGDGGGGPNAPMLESLRRARALVTNRDDAPGHIPKIKYGGNFGDFFDAVRDETANGATLPIWRGELYLEIHRATYTSGAFVKKGNRESEILMREAEYAATMASVYRDYSYPKARLDKVWQDLLLNQFHDVLPGSSINKVYGEVREMYDSIRASALEVIKEAYDVLYGTDKGANGLVGINTLPGVAREEVVQVPSGWGSQGEYVLLASDGVSDVAVSVEPTAAAPTARQVAPGVYVLANAAVVLRIEGGRITSILDLAEEKELIPEGETAGFVVYEDQPNYWDAWDVEAFHLEKADQLVFDAVEVLTTSPVRATLRTTIKYKASTLVFDLSLDATSRTPKLITIDADVDWQQYHEFLKFYLPLTISADNATYDTQFGVLQRPTHRNTSWDAARYEVCAHRFADLSEWGYGVAIVNESKYGYSTTGNVMTLSLVRGSRMPDPELDIGQHRFSFGIYPHTGTFAESDVPAVASAFNNPFRLRRAAERFAGSPVTLSGARNVVLETIKRGEDDGEGTKTVIVRLFEQYGGRGRAVLNIGASLGVVKAEVVDILEEHVSDLELVPTATGAKVTLPCHGFEIKTVRLTL